MLTTYLVLSRCLYSSKITWEETEACNTHMNTPALNPVRTVQCFRKIYSEVSLHNMKLKEFWLILSVWDLPSTALDYLGMLSPPWQCGYQVTLPLCKVKHKFFKTALFIERLLFGFLFVSKGLCRALGIQAEAEWNVEGDWGMFPGEKSLLPAVVPRRFPVGVVESSTLGDLDPCPHNTRGPHRMAVTSL